MSDTPELADLNTNSAVAAELAYDLALAQANIPGDIKRFEGTGRPYRILPDGKLEIVDALGNGPLWRSQQVNLYTANSFFEYVNRFKDNTTLVYADVIARKFTAVMSYYPKGPGVAATGNWDRHRVTLQLKHTPSWEAWIALNKKQMDQAAFAQFLEDNIPDIAEPDGSTLVSIARTLEAKVNATFSSEIRPQDGSFAFAYAENIETQAGRGSLRLPSEIKVVLQPFEGSELYPVVARIRFKLANGKLTLWYELVRIEDVLRAAFSREKERIETGLNDRPEDAMVEDVPILEGIVPGPDSK